jgi:hypothetical protein
MIHERTEKTGSNLLRAPDVAARRASVSPKNTVYESGVRGSADRPGEIPRVPPLLPVLLPLVLAAIVTGVVFAWLFPPIAPGKTPPAVRFTDVTAESGIRINERADVTESEAPAPTTLGGGVACFDYDADGDVDLLFVKGATWPWETSMAKRLTRGSLELYRNDGTGRFSDVTAMAGLNVELQGMGVSTGDFDNDGLPDVYVTCVGSNHLFHNRGKGRFEDVTEMAGVGGEENTWSTGAAWIDFDSAGRLDLVVGHYASWAKEMRLELLFTYHTGEATLFLNQANGSFRRWTGGADRRREGISTGLGAASSLPFAQLSGTNERFGALQAVMTRNGTEGEGFVRLGTKLGVALMDYDLDGRVDVFTGNASAEADVNRFEHGREFSSTPALLWNRGNEWIEVPPVAGAASSGIHSIPIVPAARGVATADFDGDGDADVVIAQHDGSPRLFRNDQKEGLPWLQIDLVAMRGAREAGGARVEVHTPSRILTQTAGPALSYMAQSSPTLIFGLGDDARVRKIVVHWPGGGRLFTRPEDVNRKLILTEQ